MVIVGYKSEHGVSRGCKGLQDVTGAYSGLQSGYCELQ